jgi:purine-binding chemotaxis protein CheW
MDIQPLLIFDLDGSHFAVDATQVSESVWLPELTPVEEAPHWIVGVFSLRGRIVPVTDLRLRFGRPAKPYSLENRIVVVESKRLLMGMIVSDVIEVIELPCAAIQPPPQFDAAAPDPVHLIKGVAYAGNQLVSLLDLDLLTRLSQIVEKPVPIKGPQMPTKRIFPPDATPTERMVFHDRAVALHESLIKDEGTHLGLAVVEMGGEYFGVELTAVQEFCAITQLSPIPCCPAHILGAMSLRGDLLTLIDPQAVLNLSSAPGDNAKAMVAHLGEQAVAIVVDDVHDVIYLRSEELQTPSPALRIRGGSEIIGTVSYAGRTIILLDLPALLAREEWIVNETA